MLKKILKWVSIVLGLIIVLAIVLVGVQYAHGQSKLSQTYNIQVEQVAIPTDAASLERGKKLATVMCAGCHGDNLAGTSFFDDPGLGSIHAKNLTRGKGGIGATYADADWVRVLRHGVRPDGTSVFVMPSKDFYYLSDTDLGSLIAYLKTIPPVDQEWGPKQFTLMGNILIGVGVFDDSMMAEKINHTAPRPVAPAVGVTKEYGDYLVHIQGCRNCHGAQLSGGKVDDPSINLLGSNLTPGGELVVWSEADFIKVIRTGVTPSGRQLDKAMPWETFAKHSDDELKAMFRYLQSLPKLATTTQ